jgi:hypothetical protein
LIPTLCTSFPAVAQVSDKLCYNFLVAFGSFFTAVHNVAGFNEGKGLDMGFRAG